MNANVYERFYKLQAMINKMVMDKARDPHNVADRLQELLHVPILDQNVYQRLLNLWFAVFGVSNTEEKMRRVSGVLQLIINEPAVILKTYLRRLEVVRLGATDGAENKESVRKVFEAGFETSGVVFSGIAPEADFAVDELIEDGRFRDFLGSTSEVLERHRMLGSQLPKICREHPDKFRHGGYSMFAVLTINDEPVIADLSNVLVAYVDVRQHGQLGACVRPIGLHHTWSAKYQHRFIHPI